MLKTAHAPMHPQQQSSFDSTMWLSLGNKIDEVLTPIPIPVSFPETDFYRILATPGLPEVFTRDVRGSDCSFRSRAKIPILSANFNISTTPAIPSTTSSLTLDPSRDWRLRTSRWRPFAMCATSWVRQLLAATLRKLSRNDQSPPQQREDHVRLNVLGAILA